MKQLYKNFVFDLVMAISALVLGIVMLPPFGIGIYVLNILLAGTIVVYFLVYLLDKLKRTKGAIFLLTVAESVVYFFIIVDLILEQFRVYDALSVCRTLGLIFWVRGTVSAIGMYLNITSSKRKNTTLLGFLLRILMISFGMLLLAHPMLNDKLLNWAMCILFYLSALAFGGLALLFSPVKNKSEDIE